MMLSPKTAKEIWKLRLLRLEILLFIFFCNFYTLYFGKNLGKKSYQLLFGF